MIRWHDDDAKSSRNRHTLVIGGIQRDEEGEGKSRRAAAVDESKKEIRQGSTIPRPRICISYSYGELQRLL